jgi:Cu2+-exporting ATPase
MSTLPELVAAPLNAPPTVKPSSVTKQACRHCGAGLIDQRMRDSGFCCAGCSYVHRLVHENGLAAYYRIKDDVTSPADPTVFQPRDYSWLETSQRNVEARLGTGSAGSSVPELTLDVQGISCAGCEWLIERVFQQQPGARDINVNAQYGSMRLRWINGEFSAAGFAHTLQTFGYLAGPAGEVPVELESRALVKRIGLCAAFAMNVMLYALPVYFGMESTDEWAGLFGLLSLAFGTLSLLVGGTYFITRGVRALRERTLHIDLPIAVGIVGAYAGSLYGWLIGEERFIYFDFVSTFILLMLVGRWAQVVAVERNRRRLLRQQPKMQRTELAEGGDVSPETLRRDQVVMLHVGQTLPVESRLGSAEGTFSLASINGEAEPRVFKAGQRVPSGAVNIGRSDLRLTTLQVWNESLLAQLLAPSARNSERPVVLERIVRGYLIGIFGVAAISGLVWWLTTGDALRTGAVITAVLVASCPCAIALAFPLADEIATIALRRRGVFVREGDLWTKLARVRKLVFDKTGTLTLETPRLQNPEALLALKAEDRRALLSLVRESPHPISQCLFENLTTLTMTEPEEDVMINSAAVTETAGYGVELGAWSLGRAGWRCTPEPTRLYTDDTSGELEGTVFARNGELLARFCFEDSARPDARPELEAMIAKGFSIFILSGDEQAKVSALAKDLGLPEQHALGALTPKDKAQWLTDQPNADAMMLGDGANDSLAFDQALCRGTPVIHRGVLEGKADFYYLGRGISGLRALFEVNAIRRRTQWFVLIFSVIYNLFAVGLAVAGKMNPLVAAALMPINSLLTLAIVLGGMWPVAGGGQRSGAQARELPAL